MNPLGSDEEVAALTRSLLHFFLSKKPDSIDDAWDLVQETLLRVLQAASEEEIASPEGYSIGVAKKITYEYYRKNRKAQRHTSIERVEPSTFKHYDTPEEQVIHKDLGVRLHYGMSKLPEKMRNLLHERFIKEVPAKVIGQNTGYSHNSIDMKVFRAKERLRKCVR